MPSNHVVLVTGCSKGGIGYALCQQLAALGCTVYATARRMGLLDGLEQHGCKLLQLDVTETTAVKKTVQHIIKEAGRIDMLVNNAGSVIKGWAIETPLKDVRQLMEVNYFAVLAVTQAVAPYMIEQRSGLIVNISSASAYLSVPQASAYTASKFAVRAYSDALRVELAPFGVHVMHVAPGFIKTNLFRSNTVVGCNEEGPYSKYPHAMQMLRGNELGKGLSGWGATDPQVFAARLARVAVSEHPPRNYHHGWMWRVFYYLGCYAPLWLTDLSFRLRLRLFDFLKE